MQTSLMPEIDDNVDASSPCHAFTNGSENSKSAAEIVDDEQNENETLIDEENIETSRVKIYHLHEEGTWIDKGTGDVFLNISTTDEDNEKTYYLQVIKEHTNDEEIMRSIVNIEYKYQRQGETILMWKDEDGIEVALSFADEIYCNSIWEKLPKAPSVAEEEIEANAEEVFTENYPDGYEVYTSHNGVVSNMDPAITIDLPEPTVDKLGSIASVLSSISPMDRGMASQVILQKDCDYLKKLAVLLQDSVDLEDEELLCALYTIFRNILSLNRPEIFEVLLSDEFWMILMTAMKHDPELPLSNRVDHEAHLTTVVQYKNICPITNTSTEEKIHQNYRVMYLRDRVLARAIDDAVSSTLSGIIFFNSVDIVHQLWEDSTFMASLFEQMKNPSTSADLMCELLQLFYEFCTLTRSVQPVHRNVIHSQLKMISGDMCVAAIFEKLLTHSTKFNSKTIIKLFEILIILLLNDPCFLREYLKESSFPSREMNAVNLFQQLADSYIDGNNDNNNTNNDNNNDNDNNDIESKQSSLSDDDRNCIITDSPGENDTEGIRRYNDIQSQANGSLMYLIIQRMLYDKDAGVQGQASEVLRLIFDGEHLDGMDSDGKIIRSFYENHISNLLQPFTDLSKLHNNSTSSINAATTSISDGGTTGSPTVNRVGLYHACELLTYCVTTHGYHFKYNIFRENKVPKILLLLKEKEKHLVLSGIRFIREVVKTRDEFYMKYIVSNDLFAPILEVFVQNGDRSNMVNSSVLDLMELIRDNNISILGNYLVATYGEIFKSIHYVSTFRQLLDRYSPLLETTTSSSNKNDPNTIFDMKEADGSNTSVVLDDIPNKHTGDTLSTYFVGNVNQGIAVDKLEESYFSCDDGLISNNNNYNSDNTTTNESDVGIVSSVLDTVTSDLASKDKLKASKLSPIEALMFSKSNNNCKESKRSVNNNNNNNNNNNCGKRSLKAFSNKRPLFKQVKFDSIKRRRVYVNVKTTQLEIDNTIDNTIDNIKDSDRIGQNDVELKSNSAGVVTEEIPSDGKSRRP